MEITRVIIIIIDACGVGEMPDAAQYDDAGAATFQHCAQAVGGLHMPVCQSIGLGNIVQIEGVPPVEIPIGAYGKMATQSAGKDSTTGHWEIGGLIVKKPFPVYPNGFPKEIVEAFEQKANIKTTYNLPASGTEIIERLGEHHLKTKEIILYTSADSVFQLAAHEDLYPVEQQYEICQIARNLLIGEHAVGRVIARPFIGEPGNFTRTANRRDFSVEPFDDTILDLMIKNNHQTLAIGKIYDLYAGRGVTTKIKTANNTEGMNEIINAVKNNNDHALIYANLVDGDQLWGHRRDPENFAKALEEFDIQLSELLPSLRDDDLLIITADHGCDPTYTKHTDHTREYVPLLLYGRNIKHSTDLGIRETFADVGKTVAEIFRLENKFSGKSFLQDIKND